jgi:hypothetical protein
MSSLPSYVVGTMVISDRTGNIWITNREAVDGRVLVCVPEDYIRDPSPDKEWVYFHRNNFGAFSEFDLLAVDDLNRIWIASTGTDQAMVGEQGVYCLDTRGTLTDSTDDRVWGPIPGLPVQEVLSLKWDPAGYIWVGSPRGAYYVSATADNLSGVSLTPVYAMRDIAVRAIDVDPAGNKWFGSDFGVSILSSDMYTVTRRITTDPPDRLPSTTVQFVSVDPYSGLAYIGTHDGTAILPTPYRDYGTQIKNLSFEPNPFNPSRGRLIFTGNSLAGGANAHIYTPDGRLVRSLSHDEAALGWDGRDNQGREVADGVYLIVTSNGSGDAAQGKVAVLRR